MVKILLAFALVGLALAGSGDADLRRAFNTAQAQKFEDGLWRDTVGRERYGPFSFMAFASQINFSDLPLTLFRTQWCQASLRLPLGS